MKTGPSETDSLLISDRSDDVELELELMVDVDVEVDDDDDGMLNDGSISCNCGSCVATSSSALLVESSGS